MSVRYAIWSHSAFWIIIFNEIIYTCKQDWSYKGVFPWEHEQFAKDTNVNKMTKSNTCILGSKSSPNMHGGPSTFLRESFLFSGNLNNNKSSCECFQQPAINWQCFRTLHMFGKLLEPKIWMLNFALFWQYALFTNHSHSHENTPWDGGGQGLSYASTLWI